MGSSHREEGYSGPCTRWVQGPLVAGTGLLDSLASCFLGPSEVDPKRCLPTPRLRGEHKMGPHCWLPMPITPRGAQGPQEAHPRCPRGLCPLDCPTLSGQHLAPVSAPLPPPEDTQPWMRPPPTISPGWCLQRPYFHMRKLPVQMPGTESWGWETQFTSHTYALTFFSWL